MGDDVRRQCPPIDAAIEPKPGGPPLGRRLFKEAGVAFADGQQRNRPWRVIGGDVGNQQVRNSVLITADRALAQAIFDICVLCSSLTRTRGPG